MPGPVIIHPSLVQTEYPPVGKKGGPSAPRTAPVPGQDQSAASRIARAHFSQALSAELGRAADAEATALSKAHESAPRSGVELVRAYVPGGKPCPRPSR